jgi:hypothetical protein
MTEAQQPMYSTTACLMPALCLPYACLPAIDMCPKGSNVIRATCLCSKGTVLSPLLASPYY